MTEPINFNKAKKARDLKLKDKRAAENRAKFGQTKAKKQVEKSKIERFNKHVDGHELDE